MHEAQLLSVAESNSTSEWMTCTAKQRQYLISQIEDPVLQHAIFLASPVLYRSIPSWKHDPSSKKGAQTERALVKYLSRMCSKPTPFGIFAGCCKGTIRDGKSPSLDVQLQAVEQFRVHNQLDYGLLNSFCDHLSQSSPDNWSLAVEPNGSLHKQGEVWHYLAQKTGGDNEVVKLTTDVFLETVLQVAGARLSKRSLLAALLEAPAFQNYNAEEVGQYIDNLIAEDVLTSALRPLIIATCSTDSILRTLEETKLNDQAAQDLNLALRLLNKPEMLTPGAPVQLYEDATQLLRSHLPQGYNASIVHADTFLQADRNQLHEDAPKALLQCIEFLDHYGPRISPNVLTFAEFKTNFKERYGDNLVPLARALDDEEELSAKFLTQADTSPLIKNLVASSSDPQSENLSDFYQVLLDKLLCAARSGQECVELLSCHFSSPHQTSLLPTSFYANAVVIGEVFDSGPECCHYVLLHADGPSAANLMGRFCLGDQEILEGVRDIVKHEQRYETSTTLAEISFSPRDRQGNVLRRPPIRDHEITYCGHSESGALNLDARELLIGVDETGEVYLYSAALKRRIVPRLTSAHAYNQGSLPPVYRFLCALQRQEGPFPNFSWGPLAKLRRLPRVRIGKVYVAFQRWNLHKCDIEAIAIMRDRSARVLLFQTLAKQEGLPRWVRMVERNEAGFAVDLTNFLLVDALIHSFPLDYEVVLEEMYPPPSHLAVYGTKGRHVHEVIIPFCRNFSANDQNAGANPVYEEAQGPKQINGCKVFFPGEAWLYLKIYAGKSALEDCLLECIAPLLDNLLKNGSVSHWFFVRYTDPQRHLRVRACLVSPDGQAGDIFSSIALALTSWSKNGRLSQFSFETYKPETNRYGGVYGMRMAELLFGKDSQAAIAYLSQRDSSDANGAWYAALIGIDALFSDFEVSLAARIQVLDRLRNFIGRSRKAIRSHRKSISDRVRSLQEVTYSLLSIRGDSMPGAELARNLFAARSIAIRPIVESIKRAESNGALERSVISLLGDYVHMHVNRFILAEQNLHEELLYALLGSFYRKEIHSTRSGSEKP